MSTDNWGGISKETAWSDWAWNAEFNCDYRYRCNASGEWEYEYHQDDQGVDADDSIPRHKDEDALNVFHRAPLHQIQESNPQPEYSISPNFSTSPGNYRFDSGVAALTQQFAGSTLNYSQDPQGKGKGVDSYNAVPNHSSQDVDPWPPQRRIFTKNPKSTVDLDPNFKQHRSKEFYFGRIFKVLWSEPYGSGGTEITERAPPIKNAKFGEKAYHSIRRFVIVDDSKKGHCICLPILTYGGQGTLKHGVHPDDHALIYTQKKGQKGPPGLLKHEYPLTKKPIRVEPISPSHKLDPASRLNYAKLYTVEHNVKVFFIGWVAKNYEQRVVIDYNSTHRPLPDRPGGALGIEGQEGDLRGTEGPDPGYLTAETGGMQYPEPEDQSAQAQYQFETNEGDYQEDDPGHGHEDLYNP